VAVTGRQEIAERNQLEYILVPRSKWNATADEIYQDAVFQVLNPLVRIPAEYCRHYRKRVTPSENGRKSIVCINCNTALAE
jgi:hypothetical protein